MASKSSISLSSAGSSKGYFTQISEGHYFRRLVERSRELTEEGYVFDIFGVDTPWRLAFAT